MFLQVLMGIQDLYGTLELIYRKIDTRMWKVGHLWSFTEIKDIKEN